MTTTFTRALRMRTGEGLTLTPLLATVSRARAEKRAKPASVRLPNNSTPPTQSFVNATAPIPEILRLYDVSLGIGNIYVTSTNRLRIHGQKFGALHDSLFLGLAPPCTGNLPSLQAILRIHRER
jgi:hypothetical protein